MGFFDSIIKSVFSRQPEEVETEGYDSGDWFVADSFSFGVEREMKESGEKAGSEDIDLGEGELRSQDSPAAGDSTPMDSFTLNFAKVDVESTPSGGTPAADELSSDPAEASDGDAGEQTYLAVELENVQITSYQLGALDDAAATDLTGAPAQGTAEPPMEELALNYSKVPPATNSSEDDPASAEDLSPTSGEEETAYGTFHHGGGGGAGKVSMMDLNAGDEPVDGLAAGQTAEPPSEAGGVLLGGAGNDILLGGDGNDQAASSNLKQIGLGMHNFSDSQGRLPPSSGEEGADNYGLSATPEDPSEAHPVVTHGWDNLKQAPFSGNDDPVDDMATEEANTADLTVRGGDENDVVLGPENEPQGVGDQLIDFSGDFDSPESPDGEGASTAGKMHLEDVTLGIISDKATPKLSEDTGEEPSTLVSMESDDTADLVAMKDVELEPADLAEFEPDFEELDNA